MTLENAALITLLALSALAPHPAMAANSEATPERWSFLITYGEESCPVAEEGEIVVCAERPESERYRIPETVREKIEHPHTGAQSLTAATETMDGFARLSRINSCSVVGTGGFTGCQALALREWFAERREDGVRE